MSKEIVTYTGTFPRPKYLDNLQHIAPRPRFLRDRGHWRRKARAAGVHPDNICPDCHDTGMVPRLNAHGDDIEPDVCMRCIHTWGPVEPDPPGTPNF